MTDTEILTGALEKAVKNGYGGQWIIKQHKGFCFYNNYFQLIFSHSFAQTLGFKLKDLGAWCDEGKEPLKFIEKLL